MKTYEELSKLPTFKERFEYLKIPGAVGIETFGFDRYLNQALYKSTEWKRVRREVIIRDNGCDLGCDDREIGGRIIVHHINPLTEKDILNRNPAVLDPNNLVCVSIDTHNAIHYNGQVEEDICPERRANDTKLW